MTTWTGNEFTLVGQFKNAKLYRVSSNLDQATEDTLLNEIHCPACGVTGYHIVIDRVSVPEASQYADIYTCIECFLTFAILE